MVSPTLVSYTLLFFSVLIQLCILRKYDILKMELGPNKFPNVQRCKMRKRVWEGTQIRKQ